VYDKTVRRRRAVLGLLVACSLILLTAYFGESGNGSLHAIQRGVLEVVTPIQSVASRALSPVRNLFTWVGDTFHAKGQVKGLRQQNNALRARDVTLSAQLHTARQIAGINQVDTNAGLGATHPVSATVLGWSPDLWFSTITIDKGTGDGIQDNMPVIGADDANGALIGKVTDAWGDGAVVTLITDQHSAVEAMDVATSFRSVVQPAVGAPGTLLFQFALHNTFKRGDIVVTSGTCSSHNNVDSLFPPNIPIGTITGVDNPGTDNQSVHVKPLINLRKVQNVQVLTRTVDGNRSTTCPQ
jgi:rod shape-determining protein MreC